MTVKELETRLKALEKRIQKLQDIEDCKNLQKSYGYYLEHWMADEIIDLFSDSPDVSLTLAAGTYLGNKSIIKYFKRMGDPNPGFLHQVMQLSGIVTVDPDGKTAKGRWYGFGLVAMSAGKATRQMFMGGIYSGEYIKENGVWKFKSLRFDQFYTATPANGWAQPERTAAISPQATMPRLDADIPRKVNFRYPSGNIVPFHYKHPVTGKKTSEEKRNAAIKKAKS